MYHIRTYKCKFCKEKQFNCRNRTLMWKHIVNMHGDSCMDTQIQEIHEGVKDDSKTN
jgi:hypothetical protein